MAVTEAHSCDFHSENKHIREEPNIGNRADWCSDGVFAQQIFTGINPATITTASLEWISNFKKAAEEQRNKKALALLNSANPNSLHVQDCGYFRSAMCIAPDAPLQSADPGWGWWHKSNEKRYTFAPVSLFHKFPQGELYL